MAACCNRSEGGPVTTGHFNGKIDNPRLYGCALDPKRLDPSEAANFDHAIIANWDFALDIGSQQVSDTLPNELHGRTVNLPTRAVTGHNWTGDEMDFKAAPAQYGAIHFHDDDLEDAQWEVGFEWNVPDDWSSGAAVPPDGPIFYQASSLHQFYRLNALLGVV